MIVMIEIFFFFNDTATTEIYTLSLHDALPISLLIPCDQGPGWLQLIGGEQLHPVVPPSPDRKSTRLNSSHSQISYAVFCLKKKNIDINPSIVRRGGIYRVSQ